MKGRLEEPVQVASASVLREDVLNVNNLLLIIGGISEAMKKGGRVHQPSKDLGKSLFLNSVAPNQGSFD